MRAPGAVCGDRSAGPSAARAAIAMPSVTISVFCADTVACHMQPLGALRVRWVPPGVASSSPDCPPDCSIRNSQACSKAQPSLLSPSPDDRSHRSQRGDCHTARRLAPTRLPSEHCRRRHSSPMHVLKRFAAPLKRFGPQIVSGSKQNVLLPRAHGRTCAYICWRWSAFMAGSTHGSVKPLHQQPKMR